MPKIKELLQAVVAAATARTTSTVTDNDLIQLYDSNNEPTIKITKSVLMDCVRASLGSLLNASGADQGTSGAKFPSINSAGVLGSMTAANLASVLGGVSFFKSFRIAAPNNATYGVSILSNSVTIPFSCFIEIGHPNSRTVLVAAIRVGTGGSSGRPYNSIVKDLIGSQVNYLTASYYRGSDGNNHFEILSAQAAYAPINVYSTSPDVSVTAITALTQESDVTVTIS